MNDQENLKLLADWFDKKYKETNNEGNNQVQKDLRRIADRIKTLEKLYHLEKKRADRFEKYYLECQERWENHLEFIKFKQSSIPS